MNQVNDRFAFQQGGHFFYPKEGETLNQNLIVENLNNAFSTWNGKLTELWGLVTTSPQTFKGGAVWGVMQSLHNAMIGIRDQLCFPNLWPIDTIRDKMCLPSVGLQEILLHVFA